MIFKRKKKGIVGVDLGSSSVKVVELKKKGDSLHLENVGIRDLAPEAIVDGTVMDSYVVVETINSLFSELGIKNNNVGISISGHAVIIKEITVPAMTEDELAESIQWEAEQYIPFDINEVNISYQYLRDNPDGRSMDLLLVVAKKDKVTDYTGILLQAGKTPILVDVDIFAIQNAYEYNYGFQPEETIALVNIGASLMNINIISGDQSVFWRDISFGGNQYTEAISRDLSLSRESAEALKKGHEVEGFTLEKVIPICNMVTEELIQELRKTLDFYHQGAEATEVNKIILSGGTAKVINLSTLMQERLNLPVEILNPLKKITFDESKHDPGWLNDLSPQLAVALGICIREAGD